jgi:predicted nucleotidyltransferase
MPPSPLPTGLLEAIASVCQVHPDTVAYLFGSHARGTADAERDLDIAVLADSSLSAEQRRTLRFTLLRVLATRFGLPIDRLDVVMLQEDLKAKGYFGRVLGVRADDTGPGGPTEILQMNSRLPVGEESFFKFTPQGKTGVSGCLNLTNLFALYPPSVILMTWC